MGVWAQFVRLNRWSVVRGPSGPRWSGPRLLGGCRGTVIW